MMDDRDSWNVWQWLDDKHYSYMPFWDGYRSPCGKYFFSNSALHRYPGDVIYFFKTGHVRNISMFGTGFSEVSPKDLGYRAHKDGRCVEIRRIK